MDKERFMAETEKSMGLMYRVAYSILKNDADCQDAVQEALLKAWRGREKLKNEQYFHTWLTRILINACHDLLRKRRHTVSLSAVPEPAEPFSDRELSEALSNLPEKLRLPLTLCYSEHMTYKEISRALRIPFTTVQSRIRRGKEMLRKELKEDEA